MYFKTKLQKVRKATIRDNISLTISVGTYGALEEWRVGTHVFQNNLQYTPN